MSDGLGCDGFPVLLNYFTSLPDANSITDGSFAVIFKSLLKKDSITKEKSLTDLSNLLRSNKNVLDELLVISWIQIYPKLAIDNSRAVRQLSHQVQAGFFQALGGKAFSKYFRSSVPIWIFGTYDPEKSVSSAASQTLLECFQSDQGRVEKLWSVFQAQILNFITICMTVEDHETLSDKRYAKEVDSINKFQRVLTACLSMITRVILLCNEKKDDLDGNEAIDFIEALLIQENMWDHLELAVRPDLLNIALLKSYLGLIRLVFANKDGIPSHFLSSLSDTRKIYKVIAKKFIKHVKLKPDSKSSSGNIVYSNIILQLWDTLIIMTNVFNLSPDILKSWKLKKSFWELGGIKASSRLFSYLSLGPCNLDPIYYLLIAKFFEAAKRNSEREEISTFKFDDEGTANYVLVNTMCKQLQSSSNYAYRTQCISCLTTLFGIFAKAIKNNVSSSLYLTIIDTFSKKALNSPEKRSRLDALTSVANYLDAESCVFRGDCLESLHASLVDAILANEEKLSVNDFKFQQDSVRLALTLLEIETRRQHSTRWESFIGDLVERLLADSSMEQPTMLFQVVTFGVQNLEMPKSDTLSAILEILPSFVEKDYIQVPLDFLIVCLKSALFGSDEKESAVADFFSKIEAVDQSQLANFCLVVGEYVGLSNESSFPEVNDYIRTLSQKAKLTDQENELIYKNASVDGVVSNRMKSLGNDTASLLGFFDSMAVNECSDIELKVQDADSIKMLTKVAFSNLNAPGTKVFLNSPAWGAIDRAEVIFEIIMESETNTDFRPLLSFIEFDHIPKTLLTDFIHEALRNIDYTAIAPSNPLGQNIYLAKRENQPVLLKSMLTIGNFMAQMQEIQLAHEEWLVSGLLVAEYMNDYLSLENRKIDVDVDRVLDIVKRLRLASLEAFDHETIGLLLPIINDEATILETQAQRIFALLDSLLLEDCAYNFYIARVYTLLLRGVFERASLSLFETMDFKVVTYAKSPLKLAVFLMSTHRYLGSQKFDRIKNYVTAEILAAKSESLILTIGLKWLTLTNNFFEAEPSIEVIPRMKLPLIMNQLTAWLDSGISYDLEFVDMRVQLANFFLGIIKSRDTISDQESDLILRLLSDNLSTCSVATNRLDLKYLTVALLFSCEKQKLIVGHAMSNLIEEALTMILDKECLSADEKANSQQVMLTLDMLTRLMSLAVIPVRDLLAKEHDLIKVFSSTSFGQYQKLAAFLLHGVILKKQQEAVVEKQFMKSGNGDQDGTQSKTISTDLTSIVVEGKDLEIGIDPLHMIDRYLWSWWLIFAYFDDVTLGMRASYIAYLEDSDLMTALLNFVFDHVDVRDAKFMMKLSTDNMAKSEQASVALDLYDIRVGYIGETESEERMLLSLHLYYLALVHCPSVVRAWYRLTRDLQRKQAIERFTSKHVLPILVRKMLNEAANGKDVLEKGDENLTIKVNNVSNEIKSTYVIDEQTMEMVVKIPHSYPLENTTVEGPLRLGVKENQWRAWLLASQRVISITNGSIMEAIEVFNKNVNLHFSGFEECAICYSILHQDLSLPSKNCPTCSNKFHSACLYKWFKSSGSSTCPLCRSSFDFRTAR